MLLVRLTRLTYMRTRLGEGLYRNDISGIALAFNLLSH